MNKISSLIVIALIVLALYMLLGFYNISATKPHGKAIESMMHIISERSIKRHAADLQNPYDVDDRALYIKGFQEYEEMCVQCHGAPGIEPSPTGEGLNPKPPKFPDEELDEFTLEEIFWVTKNGIKMTGMPAYGPTHDDKVLWAIAIFLDNSRDLTDDEYRDLKEKYSEKQGHAH